MPAHASSIAKYEYVAIISLSVLASYSTHEQTQSGSIRFQIFRSV